MSQTALISISNDCSYLAISTSTSLKLWETLSGQFEHELLPAQYLSSAISCMHFSPKQKQKKPATNSEVSTFKIALGSNNGNILIYDIIKQSVKTQIKHDENSPVNSLKWIYLNFMLSLGEKKLVAWGKKHQKLWEVPQGGISFCSLNENQFMIGSTSLHYVNYSPNNTSTYAIPAHKTSVSILVPVLSSKRDECARYVLSASLSERFIYAWQTTSEKIQKPIATLMVKDNVQTISCKTLINDFVAILVTTARGFLRYFYYHFNGRNNTKPLEHLSSLSIASSGEDRSTLPILQASFISPDEILIVYGTILFPSCERVSIDSLKGDITLVRDVPGLSVKKKHSGLVKTIVPEEKESTIHFAPTVMKHPKMEEFVSQKTESTDELNPSSMPMETRLDALSLSKSRPTCPDGRPIESYVHLLTQALHSQDKSLMNTLLSKYEDEEVIDNTIRSLPPPQVVPFLKYLEDYLQIKGIKNLTCIKWIKSLLYHHMSHLSSLPTKKQLLEPFYTLLSARMDSFLEVAKLQSRLNMLLTHVKSRHQNLMEGSTNQQYPSLLHYKDDSSDDEYVLGGLEAGPSESEDIWDDWTEDEEEEEDNEKMEREVTSSNKRKLSEEDDAISISDSDGEEGRLNGSLSSEEDVSISSTKGAGHEKSNTSNPSPMDKGSEDSDSSKDSDKDEMESLSD